MKRRGWSGLVAVVIAAATSVACDSGGGSTPSPDGGESGAGGQDSGTGGHAGSGGSGGKGGTSGSGGMAGGGMGGSTAGEAGIIVTPVSGLQTTEGGVSAVFSVVLKSAPTAKVTIPVSSSNPGEGKVSTNSLEFTAGNWDTPQDVTVTGVDDGVVDGNQKYKIVLGASSSADSHYDKIDPPDVEVTNIDNDAAGVTINPLTGLSTSEDGATATFTVVLNTQPSADVTFALSSSDTSEGTVAPASITFTKDNWDKPQTVTITGQNDLVVDGNIAYQIVTGAASSTDKSYDGLNPPDVSVTNVDNEASITVTPTSGLQTSENGATATFSVVLGTAPTSNVVISLDSSDKSEGTVSTKTLTFTSGNWSTAQTVTVTGVNDSVIDGNIAYNIVLSPATSSDSRYNGINPADVAVLNLDDDAPGVTVTPLSLSVQENGDPKTFSIVLNTAPTSKVTIDLASSDTTEAQVSPSSVNFTASNWSQPQTVTVSGQADHVADGNQSVTITTSNTSSGDANYDNLVVSNVAVTVVDVDQPGITVTPTRLLVGESKLPPQPFTVVLNTRPSAPVTIPVVSTDTTEGTVDHAFLTFTAGDWSTPQTVTVTGQNDGVADGDQTFLVTLGAASSPDSQYNGVDPNDVQVTNVDDETPGIVVVPQSLTVNETGTQATFQLILKTSPDANVDISLQSSDTTEAVVNPSGAHFDGGTTNLIRTFTVTGVNDSEADGDQIVKIVTGAAISTDPDYKGINADDVQVTNVDDDRAGLVAQLVGPRSCPNCDELRVDEDGSPNKATFTVALSSRPTGTVTVPVASNDTTEGTASPSTLTFDANNWSTPQQVTVTVVNDDIDDGNQTYQILLGPTTSTDSKYTAAIGAVGVLTVDDDTAAVVVDSFSPLLAGIPSRMPLIEGGKGTFKVHLDTQPSADVSISLVSSDTAHLTTSPSSLTFTNANYATPQTVTVTAVDDSALNPTRFENILFAPATSTDPVYDGAQPNVAGPGPRLLVRIANNDQAGVTVTAPLEAAGENVVMVRESGTSASFSVVLTAAPTGLVKIGVHNTTSSTTLSGSDLVSGALTFTTGNWNTPQTVTVTGGSRSGSNDIGKVELTIDTAATVDPAYDSVNPEDVTVINLQEDTPQVTVYPVDAALGPEVSRTWGQNYSFLMVLNTKPVSDVVMPVRVRAQDDSTSGCYKGQFTDCGPPWTAADQQGGSMDPYIDLSPLDVTFTAANYNVPQGVTVSCLTPASGAIASADWYWSEISVLQVVSNDDGYDQLAPVAPDVQCFKTAP